MQTLFKTDAMGAICPAKSDTLLYRFVFRIPATFSNVLMSLVAAHYPGFKGPQGAGVREIVVGHFEARERMESTVLRWTQRICGQQTAPVVQYNNFSGIPPHTLVLRVQDAAPFRQITQELGKLDFYLCTHEGKAFKAADRFFLPVLEKVPASVYDNLLYVLGRVSCNISFRLTELVLQKQNSRRLWTDVQHYSLNNMQQTAMAVHEKNNK